ncbi:MAG: DUF502 domain-containing protein [Candidatus Omnitrophota bacterium]
MKTSFRNYFLTGLVVLLPVVITIYVLVAIFRFADNLAGKYINVYTQEHFCFSFPGLGLLFTVIIIFVCGVLATNIFFKKSMPYLEHLLTKFPIIGKIYFPAKTMVGFLFSPKQVAFKRVVLVEYPRKGVYSMGFVTSDEINLNPRISETLTAVFVSSSPGPVTGFFVLVPKSEVIYLDISVEDGMKIIISGGILFSEEDIRGLRTN